MSAPPDYLLVGHFTADLTPNGRIAGGTVSYAVRTAASFGLRVAVLTGCIPGDDLLAELTPYADVHVLPSEHTTTFENIYEPSGRIQYVRGVAVPITPADIPERFLGARLVHLAPIAGELDPEVAFRFADSETLLTLQGWLRQWDDTGRVRFREFFHRDALRVIDTVVFSEEDIVEAPHMEREYAQTVTNLFVTRAEKGGTHYVNGVPHEYVTPPQTVLNPTGAGDVFAASLLASLPSFDHDYERAVQVAARLAATSVTRIGLASAPMPDEVAAAIAQVQGR
jgi:sugar/nucleoside kinase (ribokinase family)